MKNILLGKVLTFFAILAFSCAPIKEYKIIPKESIDYGVKDNHPIEITNCQCNAKITFDQIFHRTYRFNFSLMNYSTSEITISPSYFTLVAYPTGNSPSKIILPINLEEKITEVNILIDGEEDRHSNYYAGQLALGVIDLIDFAAGNKLNKLIDSSEEREAEDKRRESRLSELGAQKDYWNDEVLKECTLSQNDIIVKNIHFPMIETTKEIELVFLFCGQEYKIKYNQEIIVFMNGL